ncbi:response regulator receiver protein [Solidesulfovibrio carbinoliphilus subsp. oakridgensis]|uniref:Response regulator receiver protein n=1 Tax=Solidesulfovibrio carbinoliphilus subsp. oakridgensis TaxID=694327 RepID=G7Q6I4_9BACT|nr:response regulator [Solidesulfovibrio carbinoliphilus]EHJ47597.1 response regulator receiver protein [Solidesulfovibrio carbinoliphilus subsp. oakridgensis]
MKERTILLVEDNPGDVLLLEKALEDAEGVVVTVARTGDEALGRLRREGAFAQAVRPDLVILDLNLPRIDGREVLRQIKEDRELLRIPVVVLTSSKADDDIDRCYEAHANCYIIKPSGWEDFRQVVQEIKRFWLRTVRLPRQP